jgi:hypothetical protein
MVINFENHAINILRIETENMATVRILFSPLNLTAVTRDLYELGT